MIDYLLVQGYKCAHKKLFALLLCICILRPRSGATVTFQGSDGGLAVYNEADIFR